MTIQERRAANKALAAALVRSNAAAVAGLDGYHGIARSHVAAAGTPNEVFVGNRIPHWRNTAIRKSFRRLHSLMNQISCTK